MISKRLKRLFKKIDKAQKEPPKKFNHKVRKDSENMTDIEKMDKGFNGKTYTINGLDNDF
jgi:hypothetical protein